MPTLEKNEVMHLKVKKIHFIGIGGVGMSGIAEILKQLGYEVSGSDIAENYNTNRLKDMGITIYIGHQASNVNSSDLVVVSSAINDDNPEIQISKSKNIPIIPRAMMLAELMRFKYGIAIAGTHGKTTTTSLCAQVFQECGFDPTFIIGGKLASTNTNAKIGNGEYLIAEADESDASFLYLNPLIAVVTNIDEDHMDTYNHDINKLKQVFIDFINRVPFYGRAILCNEDSNVRSIIPKIAKKYTTYGFNNNSDIYAKDIKSLNGKMSYVAVVPSMKIEYPIILNTAGIHNVLNSLAVIACALEAGGKIEDIAKGLLNFKGVGRRLEHYPDLIYQNKQAIIIDDYGHHPAELKATLNAIKDAYPEKRLLLVFQPHRYTRTRDLFDEFVNILSAVDHLILLDVYAASENPIPLADSRSLARAIRLKGNTNVVLAPNLEDAKKTILENFNNNDIIVTMGAGSIGKLPQMLQNVEGK